MNPNGLRRTQRVDVFDALCRYRMDPADFEWVDAPSTYYSNGSVDALQLKGTSYQFVFDHGKPGWWRCRTSPGVSRVVESEQVDCWEELLVRCFKLWCGRLRSELAAPDPWGEVRASRDALLLLGDAPKDNSPLSPDERIRAVTGIEGLRAELLKIVEDLEDDRREINRKCDYLVDAVERLGRFDLRQLVAGALVSIAIEHGPRMANWWPLLGSALIQIFGSTSAPTLIP